MPPEHYDKITERNAATSPLLRLPAELRNCVYASALGDRRFSLPGDANRFYPQAKRSDISLLSVCRQINAETRLLPFKLNTFCLTSFNDLDQKLRRLKMLRVREIMRILIILDPIFYFSPDTDQCGKDFGDLFPGAKEVSVSVVKIWVYAGGDEYLDGDLKRLKEMVLRDSSERISFNVLP